LFNLHAYINTSDNFHGHDSVQGQFSKESKDFNFLILELKIGIVNDLLSKISTRFLELAWLA
jgi:hypothetical protein